MAWKTDSAMMNTGYTNDVFRKLDNNYSDSAVNNNWTLAFSVNPIGMSSTLSILANHARQSVKVYSLHKQASMMFDSLGVADTVGLTAMPLYNSNTTWDTGAFNKMVDITNGFDYSWGQYNQTTHEITGDSLYLLKTTSGDYKVWIQRYVSAPADSVHYEFRIAKFDNTGDTTIRLYRQNGFVNKAFAYYDAATRSVVNREPDMMNWELLFTRYTEPQMQGGMISMYKVTGVLQNPGVTVAEVVNPNADSAAAGYASKTYSSDINTMGADWKTFAGTSYTVDTAKNYLLRSTVSGKYYQLRFLSFGFDSTLQTGTGKTVYQYRELGLIPTAVSNVETPVNAFMLAPNPAAAETQILLDVKQSGNARLVVTDAMGRTIQTSALRINAGLNGYQLQLGNAAAGTYFVTVAGNGWTKTAQLLIQK